MTGDCRVLTPKTWILLSALALLGACSSTPVTPPVAVAPSVSSAPAPVPAPATVVAPVAAAVLAPHLDPKSDISTKRSVYFDFDESVLKSDYAGLIELHGKYLAANPKLAIRIEGNTDERGGAEYNLALGQKRAEAVRKALTIYGAKESQMEAMSWGKEKPKALGHGEPDWGQNRRVDLQYPTK